MGIGGIIAGALEGGAKQGIDIADKQIDLNNKQQFAQFQSGLEADRQAQSQRLAQTISQENTMFGLSPDVTAAHNAATSATTRAAAAVGAEPQVRSDVSAAELSKPREVPFGGEVHAVDPATGVDRTVMKNKTPIEDFRYPRSGAAGAAGNEARAKHYTAQEQQEALKSLDVDLKGSFGDPANPGNVNPAIRDIARQAYNDALDAGQEPIRAASTGFTAARNAASSIAAARKAAPEQTKGLSDDEIFSKLDAQRRRAPAPAKAEATPKPAAAPAPAKAPTATMDNPAPPPAAPGLIAGANPEIAAMSTPALLALASGPRSAKPASVAAARDELKRRTGMGGGSKGSTDLAEGD